MAKERKNHAQEKSAGFEEKLARLQVLSEEIKNPETGLEQALSIFEEGIGLAKSLEEDGYGAAITIAGKAAHLGGVIAANTTIPVIGIPVKGSDLGGLDALLSTVQMPPGIPVASMAINGAKNAALFAAEIIALSDDDLKNRIKMERERMRLSVLESDKNIEESLG